MMISSISTIFRRLMPIAAIMLLASCGFSTSEPASQSHVVAKTSSPKPASATSSVSRSSSASWIAFPRITPSHLPPLLQSALSQLPSADKPLVAIRQLVPGTVNLMIAPRSHGYRLWLYNVQANPAFPPSHVLMTSKPMGVTPMSAFLGYVSVRTLSTAAAATHVFSRMPLFSHTTLTISKPITFGANQKARLFDASITPTIIWHHSPWLFAVQNDFSTSLGASKQLAQEVESSWHSGPRHWPYTVAQGRIIAAETPSVGGATLVILHTRWIVTVSTASLSAKPSMTLAQSLVRLTASTPP